MLFANGEQKHHLWLTKNQCLLMLMHFIGFKANDLSNIQELIMKKRVLMIHWLWRKSIFSEYCFPGEIL